MKQNIFKMACMATFVALVMTACGEKATTEATEEVVTDSVEMATPAPEDTTLVADEETNAEVSEAVAVTETEQTETEIQ